MSEKKVFEYVQGDRKFIVEVGEMAKQANGSVLVRYEDTAVLTAAVFSKKESKLDFFPLTVMYQEKLYAAGKIPGGFFKREGRPSEHETLTARLIDRPLRPLFPEGFRNEVQVINTVLSANPDHTSEMAALLGSSLSLVISDIPFNGPVAGVIIGRVNGEFVINPTVAELEQSDIHLIVSGTMDAINMVEASAKEVPEEDMLQALIVGHEEIKKLVAFQNEIREAVGKEKVEVQLHSIPTEIKELVYELAETKLNAAIVIKEKQERYNKIDEIKETVIEELSEKFASDDDFDQKIKFVNEALEEIVTNGIRNLITVKQIRPDGRAIDEIRPLNSQVDLFERTHGSALFTRGQTQALCVTTLGALGEYQIIDGLGVEEGKRFMFHYNFPQYSVGETGRYGSPSRREVGHGALAEKSLLQVIPDEETFPYTIRIVSEVLESNGSSSQASICAGTMALMAAGVPISSPVAGIAMGLVSDGDNYTILTDIQGMEDHFGDMDFKVAGTATGITALQMDIKIAGITEEILRKSLEQARVGRLHILNHMLEVIPTYRDDVSPYAPKVVSFDIDPDKIRDVIGSGGKVISEIISQTNNVKIDISQEGRVTIMHTDRVWINKAREMVENIVREPDINALYSGKVIRIEKFGAFVEIWPGAEGLLHISKMSNERVNKVEDLVQIGDEIVVRVIGVDDKGRIDLAHKDFDESLKKKQQEKRRDSRTFKQKKDFKPRESKKE